MQNTDIFLIKLVLNKTEQIISLKENIPVAIVGFAEYNFIKLKKYFLSKNFLKLNDLRDESLLYIQHNFIRDSVNLNHLEKALTNEEIIYLNKVQEGLKHKKIVILFKPFTAKKKFNQRLAEIINDKRVIIITNNFRYLNLYQQVYLYDNKFYFYDGFYQNDVIYLVKFASYKDAKKAITTQGNYQMKKIDDLTIRYQLNQKNLSEFLLLIATLKIADLLKEEINLEEYFKGIII